MQTEQQEPEYRITESELCKITHEDDALKVYYLLKEIRSRGPIQQTDTNPMKTDPWCPWQHTNCEEGKDGDNHHCNWPCKRWFAWRDTAIAAKAREEVLDKLREWSIIQYEILGVIDTMDLKQKIESLRSEVKKG